MLTLARCLIFIGCAMILISHYCDMKRTFGFSTVNCTETCR